ncbi:MAG: hypothetical protein J6X85_07100 [Ruminococcus sp.]|nr:hypothetical protein [Ruminococcus sp.]
MDYSVIDIILIVLLVILCIIAIILNITEFISWSKAKEKVFVGNWINIALPVILALALQIRPSLITVLFLVMVILTIPICGFDCLSPEGIRYPIFMNKGISPVANHSYEYKKGLFGIEHLYIYNNRTNKKLSYNIGIKKMKTVKMLADWYGKHGYENPLTK